MQKRGSLRHRLEPVFWSLQSYAWDDYLEVPECREEIRATSEWFAEHLAWGSRRVLDVGCGTGNYALALAELGCDVLGVDFSAGMLRRARVKARQLPHAKVRFEQLDFDAGLPFAAQSFDGVIGVAVLQCAADAQHFLRDVWRVLRPGGVFLMVALDSSRRPAAKRRLRTTLPKLILRGIKALASRSGGVRRYNREQLLRSLSDAGFDVIEERAASGTITLLARVLA